MLTVSLRYRISAWSNGMLHRRHMKLCLQPAHTRPRLINDHLCTRMCRANTTPPPPHHHHTHTHTTTITTRAPPVHVHTAHQFSRYL